LQLFGAEEQIKNGKFWDDAGKHGFDSALGPVVGAKLGLPDGVRANTPASKILDDAGQLQEMGLDLGDRNNWNLLNDFQAGKITGDQFVDRVNTPKMGNPGSRVGNVGGGSPGGGPGGQHSPNTPPSNDSPDTSALGGIVPGSRTQSGGNAASGVGTRPGTSPAGDSAGAPPGSTPGNGSAPGVTTPDSGSSSSNPPGSRGSGGSTPGGSNPATGGENSGGLPTRGGGGAGMGGPASTTGADDGLKVEAVLGAGSYVVVTHNADGSFTAEVVQTDGNGNYDVVQSETFTDSDGDGTYRGDKGGEFENKPKQGVYEGKETEDGTTVTYEAESSSSDSSSSDSSSSDSSSSDSSSSDSSSSDSSGDDDSADSSNDTDVDTSDVDEYQPGPDGEYVMPLEQRIALMRGLLHSLSESKSIPGKGGKDSTPNPMNETFGGAYPFNYKDMVVRPVDGSSSTSGATVPQSAVQQIQDPNHVQGGVIDPKKD
jgi:hypothetical protein